MDTRNGRYPFVVLEGLSGVGKSSVVAALAARLNGVIYKTPPEPFERIRESVDREYGLQARFLFYLAGVYHASEQIQQLVRQQSVICDRYLLTTVCYHKSLDVRLADLPYDGLFLPDLTVLLTCADLTRLARINARGWSYNDLQERNQSVEDAFLAEYLKHDVVVVDTTEITPAAAADAILKHLTRTLIAHERSTVIPSAGSNSPMTDGYGGETRRWIAGTK
ncbi:MAG TPA: AAA family ATPase [Herpetosiphonaceae bacterium]|nr:AAA family ATPase [Herpetosiphonaceae bacterium]